jgi:hypothetical protein
MRVVVLCVRMIKKNISERCCVVCKNDNEMRVVVLCVRMITKNINTSSEQKQKVEFLNVKDGVTYSCTVLLRAEILHNKELSDLDHM